MELLKGKTTPQEHEETVQSGSNKVYIEKAIFLQVVPELLKGTNLLHVKKKSHLWLLSIHLK